MIKAHFGAGRFEIAVVFEKEDVFCNGHVDVNIHSSHSKMFSFTFLVLHRLLFLVSICRSKVGVTKFRPSFDAVADSRDTYFNLLIHFQFVFH